MNFVQIKTRRYPNEPLVLNVNQIYWIHQFNKDEKPNITRIYLGSGEFVDVDMNYEDTLKALNLEVRIINS